MSVLYFNSIRAWAYIIQNMSIVLQIKYTNSYKSQNKMVIFIWMNKQFQN